MIDWELVGIMLLITIPGLIAAAVVMVGMSRTEKLFATAFFVSFAAQLVTLNYFCKIEDRPGFHTVEAVDTWLHDMNTARTVADSFWWISVAAAMGFLGSALNHIWRDRETVTTNLRVGPRI